MWIILGLYVLPIALLTLLVEIEYFGWATLSLIVACGIFGYIHWGELLPYVKEHGPLMALYAGSYIGLGIIWTFLKWLIFLAKFNSQFKEAKIAFLRAKSIKNPDGSDIDPSSWVMPVNLLGTFKEWVSGRKSTYHILYSTFSNSNSTYETSTGTFESRSLARPQAIDHKSRIIAWGTFWPCSVAGFILRDPVRAIFTHLFDMLSGTYQAMSNRLVNQAEFQDRPLEPTPQQDPDLSPNSRSGVHTGT